MRKILIANWKMNLARQDSIAVAKEVDAGASVYMPVEMVLAPSHTAMQAVSEHVDTVALAAQNFHPDEEGNLTGEVSVNMVREFASYGIIGHSERREHFYEDDSFVHQKVVSALEHGLTPILCIGENLEERKSGQTNRILGGQIELALKGVNLSQGQSLVIAYEPVWAISGGADSRVATPEEVEEAIEAVRETVEQLLGQASTSCTYIYGGSTSPENCEEIFAIPNIAGALVGGKSLQAESFLAIADKLKEAA